MPIIEASSTRQLSDSVPCVVDQKNSSHPLMKRVINKENISKRHDVLNQWLDQSHRPDPNLTHVSTHSLSKSSIHREKIKKKKNTTNKIQKGKRSSLLNDRPPWSSTYQMSPVRHYSFHRRRQQEYPSYTHLDRSCCPTVDISPYSWMTHFPMCTEYLFHQYNRS